jgi:hypothetical protein
LFIEQPVATRDPMSSVSATCDTRRKIVKMRRGPETVYYIVELIRILPFGYKL